MSAPKELGNGPDTPPTSPDHEDNGPEGNDNDGNDNDSDDRRLLEAQQEENASKKKKKVNNEKRPPRIPKKAPRSDHFEKSVRTMADAKRKEAKAKEEKAKKRREALRKKKEAFEKKAADLRAKKKQAEEEAGRNATRRSLRQQQQDRNKWQGEFPKIEFFKVNVVDPITHCFVNEEGLDETGKKFKMLLKGDFNFLRECPYLLMSLKNAVEPLHPKQSLIHLARRQHNVAKGMPQVPKFYVLIIPGRVLGQCDQNGEHRKLGERLELFYKNIFNKHEDDRVSIEELVNSTDSDLMHYLIFAVKTRLKATEKEGYNYEFPEILDKDLQLLAAASARHDEESGTNLSWIAIDPFLRLDNTFVTNNQSDGRPFEKRGIGTFLLILMQHMLSAADFNVTLWAQVNISEDMPEKWYRIRLFFAPILKTAKIPGYIQKQLFPDSTGKLLLYHSTGLIRECIRLDVYPMDTTFATLIKYSVESILKSHGMPPFGNQMKPKNCIDRARFETIKEGVQDVKATGVLFDDNIDFVASPVRVLYAGMKNLERILNIVTSNARQAEIEMPFILCHDYNTGDMKAIERGELSCNYLCFSKCVYSSTNYYWRLRMVVAHVLLQLSLLPPGHRILDETKSKFALALISADFDNARAWGFPNSGDDYDRSGEDQQLKLVGMSAAILTGLIDSGVVEAMILTSIFDCCLELLESQTTSSSSRKGRQWNVQLNTLAYKGQLALNPTADDTDDNYRGENFFLFGRVDNQHYVGLEYLDVEPPRNDLDEVNPLIRPVNRYVLDRDKEDNTAEIKEQFKSLKAAESDKYKFERHQGSYNEALKYLRELMPNKAAKTLDSKQEQKANLGLDYETFLESHQDKPEEDWDRNDIAKSQKMKSRLDKLNREIEHLQRESEAHEKNLEYEAALHTKNAITHLQYSGNGKWEALINVDLTGLNDQAKTISIIVKESWVMENFHPKYVEYMKDKGTVNAFEDLDDDDLKIYEKPRHGVYRIQVVALEFRRFFKRDLAQCAVVYKRYNEDQTLPDSTKKMLVDKDWLMKKVETLSFSHVWDTDVGFLERFDFVNDVFDTSKYEGFTMKCSHQTFIHHKGSCYMTYSFDLPENERFDVDINNFQVQRLRWNSNKEQWEGLVNDLVTATPANVENLPNDWVEENFDEEFRQKMIVASKHKKFLKIPPGAPRTSTDIPINLWDRDAPTITFQQGNAWTCVTDSMANAFTYLGNSTYASVIHEFGVEKSNNGTTMAIDMLGEARKKISSFGPRWHPKIIDRNKHQLELLLTNSNTMKTFVLMGDDRDSSHAVTIVDRWIFDSGLKVALPLCQEALDFACGDNTKCVGFVLGYEFIQSGRSRGRARKKRKLEESSPSSIEEPESDKKKEEEEDDGDPLWLL